MKPVCVSLQLCCSLSPRKKHKKALTEERGCQSYMVGAWLLCRGWCHKPSALLVLHTSAHASPFWPVPLLGERDYVR